MGSDFFSRQFSYFCIFYAALGCTFNGVYGDVSPTPGAHDPPRPINNPSQAFPQPEKSYLPMFTLNYPRVQIPFEITLWVLLASFAKVGKQTRYHITRYN